MGKLYIAYGSNLNLAQMFSRCPSARVYAKGILNNWELVYRGSKMNAHATIRRKKGIIIPVLVWEIQDYDEKRLDRYEGFPVYYYKENIMVDINGRKKKAMVYIMDSKQKPGKPSKFYIDTIQQGYIDNLFDLSYFWNTLKINSVECGYNL